MRETSNSTDSIALLGVDIPQCPPPVPLHDSKYLSDEALLLSIRTASEQQTVDRLFEEIFDRYHARVVNWCYAVVRDREIALDLTQEVFLKVFRNLNSFRGDSRMSTWIYVITRHHCINSLRKRESDPTDFAAEIPVNLEGENGLEAHKALENAESFRKVFRAISSVLTPMEVKVLWLHYAHDLTLASITRQLLLPNRSGAKAFIVSAKRKLKIHLHNRGISPSTLSIANGARGVSAGGAKQRPAPPDRAYAA
jgi:RNA polymerase sigma-70 factor (ECF subfamily)